MTKWTFYKQHPTDPISNPIAGEFFSSEAVGDVTGAVVREGIQNSLDARLVEAGGYRSQAKVRIFLSENMAALQPEDAKRWFASAWRHFQAPRNGLREPPSPLEICPFLVFEDFGTTGLTGDPGQYHLIQGVSNNFMNFFRAEGHSDKGNDDRGSWGVGKTVFPRASRISAFFGLTVRADDRKRLLFGHSILKYHQVDGESFKSDGCWGECRSDGLVLPCADSAILDQLCADFRIARKSDSGLSIVVPWYEMDNDEGITVGRLIQAVLHGFFYPILMGHLSVTIDTPTSSVTLDQGSIDREVRTLGHGAISVLPWLELALWAQTRTESEFVKIGSPAADGSQRFEPDLVSEGILQEIREALSRGDKLAIRFPLYVQPRSGAPTSTFFNAFLERAQADGAKPIFVRDELIIPDVDARSVAAMRALVIVEERPLATLLRDAETPAHTQWSPRTATFKKKYKFGSGVIRYVSSAVSELMRLVNQSDRKPDPSLTVDYFSIPALPTDDDAIAVKQREATKHDAGGVSLSVGAIPRRPKQFRIGRVAGGFTIVPGDAGVPPPATLEVAVAYDLRRGNPLKKYHPADFDLGNGGIHFAGRQHNVKVVSASNNRVLISIQGPDFHLTVAGFDANRDLYVRADARQTIDVD